MDQVAGYLTPRQSTGEMKARQRAKIRDIGAALQAAGYTVLDRQAEVLGLARSTTWSVLRGGHKSSGLSAAIIKRILAAPQVPPAVHQKLLEYVAEKSAGHYGHCPQRRRKFLNEFPMAVVQTLPQSQAGERA
jgi:hypothetical protein